MPGAMTSSDLPAQRPSQGPDPLLAEIDRSLKDREQDMIDLRRAIHSVPEPSGKERTTTAMIAKRLQYAGLEPRLMADGIGVVADLDVAGPGNRSLALRAELDSVAVHDEKSVAYTSTNAGLCHACGHDAHTAMLANCAHVLASHRGQLQRTGLRHNLRFIFQPAEETATGARSLIEQNVLQNVAAIAAIHVDPSIEVGRIGIREGAMTAACRLFKVCIHGRGGHSARPHEAIDPIPAAVNLISQMYQLCPRSIDGRHALSLTIGAIHAGSAPNAIPDEASISGTLRAARMEDMDAVQHRIHAVVEGVAAAIGCQAHLEVSHDCPATINDPALVKEFVAVATAMLGDDAVTWLELPSMGGEDFAFYQQHVPGVFVRLGAAMRHEHRRPLHSTHFDIDEHALLVGAGLLARFAVQFAGAGST